MSKQYIKTNKDTKYENVDTHQQGHTAKRTRKIDGCLLELPVPIIYDILSRLPISTLFSCICVCKTFPDFHKDPYFAQIHLDKSPKDGRFLIIQDRLNASNVFFINFSDFDRLYPPPPWNNNHHAWDSHLWKTLNMPTNISGPYLKATLVGSCNGLVCLFYHINQQHNMMCVCNPILGEFRALPHPSPDISRFSFGFCPKSKVYKVILFTFSCCEIHTLGTNHWNKKCNIPYPMTPILIDSSFLNGNIPWVTESSNVSEMICSFDLETEQYMYISPPPHFFTDGIWKRMSFVQVGVLRGLFCISYILDNFQFEVYVMNNYGVGSSWTKEITFYMDMKFKLLSRTMGSLYLPISYWGLHAITLLNNRDILFSYLDGIVVYYSPRKAGVTDVIGITWEKHEVTAKGVYDVVEFVPSFISLRNIGKGGNVEVAQREKHRAFGLSK